MANPAGQIFALTTLLRESFGLRIVADTVERAVRQCWREGWRTKDVMERGCRLTGTREMATRVIENLLKPSVAQTA